MASRGPFRVSFSLPSSLSHSLSRSRAHTRTCTHTLIYLTGEQNSPRSTCPPNFHLCLIPPFPSFKPFRRLQPLEDRPCRLHAASYRPLLSSLRPERSFLSVAQQRPRKGPHFSSEGVSPRGNCAIATSAPVKTFLSLTSLATFPFHSYFEYARAFFSSRSSIPESRVSNRRYTYKSNAALRTLKTLWGCPVDKSWTYFALVLNRGTFFSELATILSVYER